MAVNAAPSGEAPPGWLRFGAATMALATAFDVAACASHADNSAGPAAAGPHNARPDDRSGPDQDGVPDRDQFAPENVAIAHHAVVYAVPPGGAAALREQDAKTPGLAGSVSAGPAWPAPRSKRGTRRGWTPGRAW
jgi:hypothetical protein